MELFEDRSHHQPLPKVHAPFECLPSKAWLETGHWTLCKVPSPPRCSVNCGPLLFLLSKKPLSINLTPSPSAYSIVFIFNLYSDTFISGHLLIGGFKSVLFPSSACMLRAQESTLLHISCTSLCQDQVLDGLATRSSTWALGFSWRAPGKDGQEV